MSRRFVPLLLALSLALAGSACAQSIAALLPADTMFALGTQDLDGQRTRLDPFIAEFERLGIADALEQIFASDDEGDGESDGESGGDGSSDSPLDASIPESLRTLDPLDLVGNEAWVALSVSPSNPLPALTLVARTLPAAGDAFRQAIAEAAADPTVESLQEGDTTFYLKTPEEGDGGPADALAFAQVGDVVALSSNPDALRGVLRRLAGSSDPGFAASEGYQATLGALGAGNFYGYLDYARIAETVEPYSQGLGFDALVGRLLRAFDTAGVSAGVLRLTDDGLQSSSLQLPNAEGGDPALYALITDTSPASQDALAFVPATALSVSAGHTDLTGWWDYLNDLVASTPELGVSSLDDLVTSVAGIDLRASLFDWTAPQVTTLTTGTTPAAQPGVPSANLLGENVFLIATRDEAAAQAGLAQLFQSMSMAVAGFADPSGGMGNATSSSHQAGGVEVTSYAVTNGVSIAYAVADGYALIGTSVDAIDAALEARAAGGGLPAAFADRLADVPADATGFTLSDDRAALEGTATQIGSQLQTMAGLGGGSDLDFDAVQGASDKVEEFLMFVAERLGGSVSYRRVEGGTVVGAGHTQVNW